MKRSFPSVFAAVTAAVMLAACGGSGGDSDFVFEDENPEASNRSGSVAVAGSATAALNGVYASNNVFLNAVEKVNPIGSDPELCRFRFSRLEQAGTARVISGDVRYQPGTPTIRVMFIAINNVDYSLVEPAGTVDRVNDEIDLAGARFSTGAGGDTITLTGSIPMRDNRPQGC
ncbi:MAG: hypothetical protein JWP65_1533 [Ramlibacter sp.]|jgi:hypothetical protein|uniref:hypothetical protein n=1 Tax=Ramlibacter sp. TaxID=1917967 RepID=UPI00262D9DCC|nr:hypothetical protein [Ramlibacter sp.]MDB5751112.1 hypothetical protein [Ramlibacter sp.]